MIKKVCFLNSNFDKNTLSRCVFKIKNLQEKSVTITRESKYETTIEVRKSVTITKYCDARMHCGYKFAILKQVLCSKIQIHDFETNLLFLKHKNNIRK